MIRVEHTHPHQPEQVGHRHRDLQGGWPRAAVFGVSDGLLTNVSLVLGVAGAHPAAGVVRLTGIAGLIAGAFSMAAGEYVSMTAQQELLERELAVERRELERNPIGERKELAATYRSRGIPREDAERMAASVMQDVETALDVHAREELGFSPDQTGNPRAASLASLVSFALGAVIPLLPWFFLGTTAATIASIILGGLTSLAIGYALGVFTDRSRVRSALRQLVIAAIAASVTYAVGVLAGSRVT